MRTIGFFLPVLAWAAVFLAAVLTLQGIDICPHVNGCAFDVPQLGVIELTNWHIVALMGIGAVAITLLQKVILGAIIAIVIAGILAASGYLDLDKVQQSAEEIGIEGLEAGGNWYQYQQKN